MVFGLGKCLSQIVTHQIGIKIQIKPNVKKLEFLKDAEFSENRNFRAGAQRENLKNKACQNY